MAPSPSVKPEALLLVHKQSRSLGSAQADAGKELRMKLSRHGRAQLGTRLESEEERGAAGRGPATAVVIASNKRREHR
jgi:hypothetical protein